MTFHVSAPRQYVTTGYMIKWKANCLLWLNRYSEAADTYCFAIEIDHAGHEADLYRQLACCYERLGSYSEAIAPTPPRKRPPVIATTKFSIQLVRDLSKTI